MKTETKNTLLAYEQPESYEIMVRARKMICTSPIDNWEEDDDPLSC